MQTTVDENKSASQSNENSDKSKGAKMYRYRCKECNKNFKYGFSCDAHQREHETGHIKCEECDVSFKTIPLFTSHFIQKHLSDIGRVCTIAPACKDLKFPSKSLYKVHLNSHCKDRKFKCKQCPSTFRAKPNLQVHMKGRHSNLKEHICPVCTKAFPVKQYLINHLKRNAKSCQKKNNDSMEE